MPTLNRYVPSNQKSGHYIRANVGSHHPVTLQTTEVAERILKDNKYTDGSTLPTKLVWGMYEVGLLYTESSLSAQIPSSPGESSLSELFGSAQLSKSTRKQLIAYLGSYSGPRQDAIMALRDQLQRTLRNSSSGVSSTRTNRSTRSAPGQSGRVRRTNSTTNITESGGSSTRDHMLSTPWRIRCPFCNERIHNGEDAFVQHWAHSSRCEFSANKSVSLSIIKSDWVDIVEKVMAERERPRSTSSAYSECPYCTTRLEHRSARAYLNHWTDNSCNRVLESLPNDRPTEVPVEVWWEIKDDWSTNGMWGHADSILKKDPSSPKSESETDSGYLGSVVSSVRNLIR